MKTYTWPELFKVVRYNPAVLGGRLDDVLRDFVRGFPAEYHDLVGLALSVVHWHPSNHKALFDHDDIYDEACGLCAIYRDRGMLFCRKECPLIRAGHDCCTKGSKWSYAFEAVERDGDRPAFNRAATVMYVLLRRLYEAEYKRCQRL